MSVIFAGKHPTEIRPSSGNTIHSLRHLIYSTRRVSTEHNTSCIIPYVYTPTTASTVVLAHKVCIPTISVCDNNVVVMVAIRNDTTSYIFMLHSIVLPTNTRLLFLLMVHRTKQRTTKQRTTKQRTTKHTLFGGGRSSVGKTMKNRIPQKHKRTIDNVNNGVHVSDYSVRGARNWVAKHK
jgi:hypothetical protein